MPDTTELAPVTQPRELAAVAPKAGRDIMAFIPSTPEEIKWTVGMIVGAGLAPDSYKGDQKKIAIGIMKGLEIGMPPLAALSNIAIINGRPTIWGDGAIALAQGRGVLAGIEEIEIGTTPGPDTAVQDFAPDYGIEVKLYRKGVQGAFVGRFTVGDAKRAKLWANASKQPWMLYPKRMLRMRAVGFAIRNGFADCLAGMYIREELEDMPSPPPERVNTSFLNDDKTIDGESYNIWACPEGADFETWFRTQVNDVVETVEDITNLVDANRARINDECHLIAGTRKAELARADEPA